MPPQLSRTVTFFWEYLSNCLCPQPVCLPCCLPWLTKSAKTTQLHPKLHPQLHPKRHPNQQRICGPLCAPTRPRLDIWRRKGCSQSSIRRTPVIDSFLHEEIMSMRQFWRCERVPCSCTPTSGIKKRRQRTNSKPRLVSISSEVSGWTPDILSCCRYSCLGRQRRSHWSAAREPRQRRWQRRSVWIMGP